MTRQEIFEAISAERYYQDKKWGRDFDKGHDQYHWVAFICKYAGKAINWPFDKEEFVKNMIKVAAIAVGDLEIRDDVKQYNEPKETP